MPYFQPVGGNQRVFPGGISVLACPFNLSRVQMGARMSILELPGANKPLAVACPVPYGPECDALLNKVGSSNVNYLITPNAEHDSAVKTWSEKFPGATVVGPVGIEEKTKTFTSNFIGFGPSDSSKLLSPTELSAKGLGSDFSAGLDVIYLNGHKNKEFVIYHKSSKSLIVGDLILNLPAYEQYKGSGVSPTSALTYFVHWLKADSFLGKYLENSFLKDKKDASKGLNIIYGLPFERILPCHGDIIEAGAKEKFKDIFQL